MKNKQTENKEKDSNSLSIKAFSYPATLNDANAFIYQWYLWIDFNFTPEQLVTLLEPNFTAQINGEASDKDKFLSLIQDTQKKHSALQHKVSIKDNSDAESNDTTLSVTAEIKLFVDNKKEVYKTYTEEWAINSYPNGKMLIQSISLSDYKE